jgi:uncharacterized protein YjeT (DUF2065 family)
MSQDFFIGIALVLVFEGMLPFISPKIWRNLMLQMITQKDHVIRWFGLFSMLAGVFLLYVVH